MKRTKVVSGSNFSEIVLCSFVLLVLVLSLFGMVLGNSLMVGADPENELPQQSLPDTKTTTGCRSAQRSTYSTQNIHNIHGGSLAGGVAAENFDDDEYLELIFVGGSSDGRTSLVDYNDETDEFSPQTLWWDPNGGLLEVEVAELDNTKAGREILVGGFSGNLTLLYFNDNGTVGNITIWNTSNLNHIFGIAVGDVNDDYSGNEIAVVDATAQMVYILTYDGNAWDDVTIAVNDVPRGVYIGDFDQSHQGDEVLVLCVNGTVYGILYENDNWSTVEIFKDSNSPMSAAIVELNNTNPGNEIIIASLSRNATLLWGSGSNWYNEIVWRAEGALEGIAFGDFDRLHAGDELCIAGYSNTAEMIYEVTPGWYNETIFYDPDPLQSELNGAIVADFYPPNPGTELLVIGYRGPVWMLIFQPPNFELFATTESQKVMAGEFATYNVNLLTYSGYDSDVTLTLSGLPPGCTYDFSRETLSPTVGTEETDSSVLTIFTTTTTPASNYTLSITGTSSKDSRKRFLNITLDVEASPVPDFIVKITPRESNLNISKNQYNAEFSVEIEPINQFDDEVRIYIPEEFLNSPDVKDKFQYEISKNTIGLDDVSVINIIVSRDVTESFDLSIPIRAENTDLDLVYTTEIDLNVIYYKSPPSDDGPDAPEEMHRWVSIGIMLAVIIVISLFMIKRMRDITKIEQKRREEMLQRRQQGPPPRSRRRK